MTNATGTNQEDIHHNAYGERVYPCRCGVTHNGQYAAEDYEHHNCFHTTVVLIAAEQAICQNCGASFTVVYPPEEKPCQSS